MSDTPEQKAIQALVSIDGDNARRTEYFLRALELVSEPNQQHGNASQPDKSARMKERR